MANCCEMEEADLKAEIVKLTKEKSSIDDLTCCANLQEVGVDSMDLSAIQTELKSKLAEKYNFLEDTLIIGVEGAETIDAFMEKLKTLAKWRPPR